MTGAMDTERLRTLLDDDEQAEYVATHPASRWEWPLILLAAAGVALILTGLALAFAGWWVS